MLWEAPRLFSFLYIDMILIYNRHTRHIIYIRRYIIDHLNLNELWRIRELNLKGCRLRPAFLKKALQEHPLGRSQGWLPTETLASLPLGSFKSSRKAS